MKKTFLPLTLALLLSSAVHAQKIKSVSNIVDMGQVRFYTPAKGTFELKNSGGKALVISKIDTGCGCAVASYPKENISPGSKFTITVTYDAKMMGHFNKIIEVYSNASSTPLQLELRGVVVETVEDYIGDFPFELGTLKADCNYIEFEDVRLGEIFQQKFHIYNPTNKSVNPTVMHLPNYLKADISPSKVEPNRSAEVTITLDSRFMRDYGVEDTHIYLGANPGERVTASKQIDVSTILLPSRQELTEAQQALAPKIQLSTTRLHMPVSDGKKKTAVIDLQNVGKSRLEIQKMQLMTAGLNVELNKSILMPGEMARLKVSTSPKQLKNIKTRPRVIMITNDPLQPKVVIEVDIKDIIQQ